MFVTKQAYKFALNSGCLKVKNILEVQNTTEEKIRYFTA